MIKNILVGVLLGVETAELAVSTQVAIDAVFSYNNCVPALFNRQTLQTKKINFFHKKRKCMITIKGQGKN